MSESNNNPDVVIVGAGPVGLVLALLLAKQQHQVLVIERWDAHFPLPRAVAIAHEPLRTLVSVGFEKPELLERWGQDGQVFNFQDAEGRTLIETTYPRWERSGYAPMHAFSQPEIEVELNRLALDNPNITLRRGVEVTAVEEQGDSVEVKLAEWDSAAMKIVGDGLPSVRGTLVVGCDGANSLVRRMMGVELQDFGFTRDWYVVDVDLKDNAPDLPYASQHLDPERPTTLISGGPGHRRFEFMLKSDETDPSLSDETVWALLNKWRVTPENAKLVRHARYRFVARVLEQWNRGRLLLAGDSAHQMPPFLGQGFNSGMRDAANLAWRIDDVLRGRSGHGTFDDYSSERHEQVSRIIAETVRAAGIICEMDPERARIRDEKFRSRRRVVPGTTSWDIEIRRGAHEDPLVGTLAFQAPSSETGLIRPLDAKRRGGPLVLWSPQCAGDGDAKLDDAMAERWNNYGGDELGFGAGGLDDPDGAYAAWFASAGVQAVLMRPDFYVYGSATNPAVLTQLVQEFMDEHA